MSAVPADSTSEPLSIYPPVGTDTQPPVEPEIPPETPASTVRGDTTYVIIALTVDEDTGDETWTVEDESQVARTPELDRLAYAETVEKMPAEGIVLVAVAEKFWAPKRVKPKTVTTLELEDA